MVVDIGLQLIRNIAPGVYDEHGEDGRLKLVFPVRQS
jgi:hypothetical protein